MENKLKTVIEKIVTKLENKSYVDGVLLFGSCARSIKLEHKDIDFYVLINENWYQRRSRYYNGVLVELFFNPYERYLYYFENEESLFTAQMFATGKILFDKTNRMKELKKIAKKTLHRKLKLDKDTINMIRYSIADANLDIERELKIDKYQALHLMNRTLEMLMRYHFKIKKIPEPKYNYIVKKIKETDPKLYVKIKDFFDEANIESKFAKLNEIEKMILKSIGVPKLTWISSKKYFT